ncbi:SH2 domain-containing adapter protein E-like isoform X2 [Corythoichthys intestinalis]|uniref:SH2 domain-containing adapter protein E-like isoform X2 n=1 Tax=Corythoichthys intestinalis TaxID=161448 RepID=UPI0025A5CD92|nr:SH2 domain-containing adapter protein E-like isoform X2 [Corythoichthys intestinalis]
MSKWFKEFHTNLKNGTKTSAFKTSLRKNSSGDGGGLAGSILLPGKNRKNSATELSSSQKDGKTWENVFLAGKGRKNSVVDPATVLVLENVRKGTNTVSSVYINRMIRVDTLDKNPNFDPGTVTNHQLDTDKQAQQYKTDRVTILEDYADPFDANHMSDQQEHVRPGDNDGYMEPYDAQLMITEIRRRGSKDLLQVQMGVGEVLTDSGQSDGCGEAHFDSPNGPPKYGITQRETQHQKHTRQKSWTQKILMSST